MGQVVQRRPGQREEARRFLGIGKRSAAAAQLPGNRPDSKRHEVAYMPFPRDEINSLCEAVQLSDDHKRLRGRRDVADFMYDDTWWINSELLGEGSYGTFYKVHDSTNSAVVRGLKVVPPLFKDGVVRKKPWSGALAFATEVLALRTANSVGVGPRLFGWARCGPIAAPTRGVMLLEVWEGDCYDLVHKRRAMTPAETLALLAQVDVMHSAHILHNDLAEQNVFFRPASVNPVADVYECTPADFGKALSLHNLAVAVGGGRSGHTLVAAVDDARVRWKAFADTIHADLLATSGAGDTPGEFAEWIADGAPWNVVTGTSPAAHAQRASLIADMAVARERAKGNAEKAAEDDWLLRRFAELLVHRTLMLDVLGIGFGLPEVFDADVVTVFEDGHHRVLSALINDKRLAMTHRTTLEVMRDADASTRRAAHARLAAAEAAIRELLSAPVERAVARKQPRTRAQSLAKANADLGKAFNALTKARRGGGQLADGRWFGFMRESHAMHWPTYAQWVRRRAGSEYELQRALRESLASRGVDLSDDSRLAGIDFKRLVRPAMRPWFDRLVRYVFTRADFEDTARRAMEIKPDVIPASGVVDASQVQDLADDLTVNGHVSLDEAQDEAKDAVDDDDDDEDDDEGADEKKSDEKMVDDVPGITASAALNIKNLVRAHWKLV